MGDNRPPGLPPLEPGTVHLQWFTTTLAAAELDALGSLLDDSELARASRFHFARDRDRYVAARGRLRVILGQYAGEQPAGVVIAPGRHGKPELRLPAGAPRLSFNLSRSGEIAVAAIGLEEELGIDVERLRPFGDALTIAERVFTGTEAAALRDLAPEERPAAFFRYWTRKEAVVKSLGLGLGYPLDAFSLSAECGGAERLELESEGVRITRWVAGVDPPYEEVIAALATAEGPAEVHSRVWPPS